MLGRLLWPLGVVALLAGQVCLFHDVRYDDPFITYRYAQNLALGRGLTFNPGERFLGATAPGHMLLAALVYPLAGLEATPSVMSALGCAGWTAQAVAVYLLLAGGGIAPVAAAITAAAVGLGASASHVWVSFETNLVAAFMLWALVLAQRARWPLAAGCAALACLMRPDAALLALPLAVLCVVRTRGRALPSAGIFLALTVPWVVFAWAYYGSPLPHSAVEKFQKSPPLGYARHIFDAVAGIVVPFASSAALSALVWALVLAAAWAGARRDRIWSIAVLYAGLHLLAYQLMRPIAAHNWHLYPLFLFASVAVLAALASCALNARRLALLRHGAGLALAALIGLGVARTVDAARSHEHAYWSGARHATYRLVSRYLREHASPGDHFASIEVGTLAYYSDLPAYDLGGLITHLRRIHIIDRPVRWLVLGDEYLEHGPRFPPVAVAEKHGFRVSIFYLPPSPLRR